MKYIFLPLLCIPLLAAAESDLSGRREESLSVRIGKAKLLLRNEHPAPIYKIYKGKRELIGKETLRVVEAFGKTQIVRIELIRIVKSKKTAKGSKDKYQVSSVTPPECTAEKIGGGGVNTNYRVECAEVLQTVLAGKDLLSEKPNQLSEAIYVPYSDALATTELIRQGRAYLWDKVLVADASLRAKKVRSRAIGGRLVADVIDKNAMFNLAVIEHIDHDEFSSYGPVYSLNKVLTLFGANGADTYQYARSRTGALCLMQIMPSTYKGIQAGYREAKLPKSAIAGSCDGGHAQAIEVGYLVMDSKLALMPVGFKAKYQDDMVGMSIFLAAAYNAGNARSNALYNAEINKKLGLKDLLDKFFVRLGLKKDRAEMYRIMKNETWVYIKKYFEILKLEDGESH